MKKLLVSAAAGAIIGLSFAAAASAYAAPQQQAQSTPKGWNWTFDKNGKRVPKGEVTKNPDGSVREVIPGKCPTIKETSPGGEVKISSSCPKPR